MMERIKRFYVFGIIMAIGGLAAGGWAWNVKTNRNQVKVPVFGDHALKVNGKFVETVVFHQERNRFYQRWKRNGAMMRKSDEELDNLVLEEVINRAVLEDYLQKQACPSVTSSEVDRYITRYIKAQYSTSEALQVFRESMFCKNDAELQQMVRVYLQKLRVVPLIAKNQGCQATVAEVEAEYRRQREENRQVVARHILIAARERTPGEAEKRARELYERANKGEDFGALVKQYSDDPSAMKNAGYLEPMTRSQVPPQFNLTLFSAPPGQIIPLVNTEYGWEIVKVEKLIEYAHSRSAIEAMLAVEKFSRSPEFEAWLAKLRGAARIVILEPRMQAYRYFTAQKYALAGRVYEKVYRQTKQQFYLNRALESYQAARNWSKMIELSRMGIKIARDYPPYYLAAAEGFHRTQSYGEALKMLKTATRLSEGNRIFTSLTLDLYAKLGIEPGKD